MNIVQLQDVDGLAWGRVTCAEWGAWWQREAAGAVLQQREAMEWWVRLSRCWAAPECGRRKVLTLMQHILSALVASSEASAVLVANHQRRMAGLSGEAQRVVSLGSPAAAHAFAASVWPRASEMARAWAMIPASGHARIAAAWAEFWSLPSGEPSEELDENEEI